MKKIIYKAVAVLLILTLAVSFISCSAASAKKYVQIVMNYLKSEYPGRTFELLSVSQDKSASGRYEIGAVCKDDNIKFDIYAYSSVMMTDSYSVIYANKAMNAYIHGVLSENSLIGKVDNVNWIGLYKESGTDFSFSKVDITKPVTLEAIKSIDTVSISDSVRDSELGEIIYNVVDAFNKEEIELENVGFEFNLDSGKFFRIKTNSEAVLGSDENDINTFILESLKMSAAQKANNYVWNAEKSENVFEYEYLPVKPENKQEDK